MPRSYRHIKEYENEILELKTQGYTKRETRAKHGFAYQQVYNLVQSKTGNTVLLHYQIVNYS